MAISDGTAGAWTATTTRNPTVTLPTHSAGQMLLVRMAWKSATPTTDVAVCNTSGWAKVGQFYNGGGVSSNGGGGVLVAEFWKEAASGAETNPVIEFDDATGPTPGAYSVVTYNKGSDEAWLTPVGDGGSVAAATSYSGTAASHVAATSGDMLDAFVATNDNTTLTVPTVAQTGLTLDTVTEYPATALSSATSNDISADGCNRLATAGTSSAAAVMSGTNSVADPGAVWITRLRVVKAITLGLLDSSRALYAPTILRPYYDSVDGDAPIRYFRLGEPSGTTMTDDTATENGTYVNTPTLGQTGALANDADTAAAFANASAEYGVVKTAKLLAGLGASTVELWFKSATATTVHQALYCERDAITATSLYKFETSSDVAGKLRFTWQSDNALTYDLVELGTLANNTWHHCVVTVSGTNVTLYLDGVNLGGMTLSENAAAPFASGTIEAWLGADKFDGAGTGGLDGTVDELALYNYALTDAQVAAHYANRDVAHGAGAKTVTLGLLESTPALYAPTLIQDQFVTLGLLDSGAALYAPTLTPKNDLTLGLLESTPTLYAPTLATLNAITLGLLDAAPALYAPTVIIDQFVTLGLLDGAPALYAPTLAAKNTIELGLIDAGPTLYAPTLATLNAITLGLLDAGADLYAPTISQAGGSTQALTLDLLDASSALFAPTLLVGPVTVTLGLLDASPALFAPTLTPQNLVELGLLDSAPATFAPSLALYSTLTLPLLDAAAALYAPTVVPAAVTVTLGLLDAAAELYAPSLLALSLVSLPLLDAGADVYAPTIVQLGALALELPLLDGGAAVYPPTIAELRISGVTRDSTGAALGSCRVALFRTSDDAFIRETTSDPSGGYVIGVQTGESYYLVAYLDGSPDLAGTTVNTLVGVPTP